MKIAIHTEDEMQAFAAKMARAIDDGIVIYLHGLLGAGKTTFARGFLSGLGYDRHVRSPTYTLVEPYEIAGKPIFHFDFYRIQDADELEFIGIKDYFFPEAICLVEWPEKGFPLLPDPDLNCYIEFINPGRTIEIEAETEKGAEVLDKL